jgi:hypothetical protein
MSKIKELAAGCLLAACAAAIGAAFIVREAWRLVRPGGRRSLHNSPDEPVASLTGD